MLCCRDAPEPPHHRHVGRHPVRPLQNLHAQIRPGQTQARNPPGKYDAASRLAVAMRGLYLWGMSQLRKNAPRWRIKRIRGNRAEVVGVVPAADEKAAIKTAIELYQITDPEKQKRLVAVRED